MMLPTKIDAVEHCQTIPVRFGLFSRARIAKCSC